MTSDELTTLARECDALVEQYDAKGDTVEELLADLTRRVGDEQARLRAEIDQLDAALAELDNETQESE